MRVASTITNALQTPLLLYRVIKNINRQKVFIQKKIEPEIAIAKKQQDGSIDDTDIKKLKSYYGLAVPAVLGEAFCVLRGKKMTETERLSSTCQGAITGLGDDFFDKQRLSNKTVKDIIDQPESSLGNSALEKLSLHFYETALANAPDRLLMKTSLNKVYFAQLLSKKQEKHGLGYEEIKDITLRKGAESLLFYRTAFANPLLAGEEKMMYCLGGLMQLCNDIFDVYTDQQNGIDTLLTTAKIIKEVRLLFMSLLKTGYSAAYETAYPQKNIRKFLNILSICIFSRCMVCMDQLEKNEQKSNNIFTPAGYKRKDLICDMDTAKNKWRSLKYHISIGS